jgi:hypothetical protein
VGSRGPTPGFKQARLAAQQPQAAPADPAPVRQPVRFDPLRKGVRMHEMTRDELADYARGLGIVERDVIGLTDERLRQNCAIRLHDLIEEHA